MIQTKMSFWKVFRLIFVIFSLYLLQDVFSCWDGFRYHSTFYEFLPAAALITLIWTIVGVITAILLWLFCRLTEWFCKSMGWKVRIEHLLVFILIFVLMGAAIWGVKLLIWYHVKVSLPLKLAAFVSVSATGIILTWLFRDKDERWMGIIQERITPLVWLFGVWIMLSAPLVAYHTWWKQTDDPVSRKPAQSSVADKDKPNIILVTFDALTAQDMSVYGYYRPTTPFITEWAKEAALFLKAEAAGNFTDSTTASLMTGKRVWKHRRFQIGGESKPNKSDSENMALLLKNNGYYNMAFIVNPLTSVHSLGISGSFDYALPAREFSKSVSLFGWKFGIIDVLLDRLFGGKIKHYDWIVKEDFIFSKLLNIISRNVSQTEVPPEIAFNRFLSVVDNGTPEPFFAWIHVFPPHGPYLPPEPYMGMFNPSPSLRTFKEQMREDGGVDIMRDRYDEFIRYCDKQFEDFIAQIKIRSKLKNTVIILSSDHGESFEHNILGHSQPHLYESLTHIPLIIREPNKIEGRIIADFARQIDIPATILDLAGVPLPVWMRGRSLVPLMRGGNLPSIPVFSMNFMKNPTGNKITRGTIAVRDGDYKLIHYLEEQRSLLFNLKEDPSELNNLIEKEPETAQRLIAMIKDNVERINKEFEEIEKKN